VLADNRGQVYINLNAGGGAVDNTTISKSSVLLYSAGADAKFGTTDDVRLTENVAFNTNINRIIVTTKVAPNVGYRVRLIASRIKLKTTNELLDGDFHGTYPTGNGSPGGDYNALTKIDKTTTPTIRMITSFGSMAIKLDGVHAPVTTNYFVDRANRGFYDNVMFNQSTSTILESGIIKVGSDNKFFVTDPGTVAKVPEVTGLSNSQGTIAMSRLPIDGTKEGNGFFFNMASSSRTTSVFGSVTSGFNVLQQINALTAITLAPEHQFTLADTSKVPVTNSSINHSTYLPFNHSAFINRTAVQMRVVAMS
jgi:peptidyl-prolyl cis-trans isomerase A (cyclophilin A)